MKKVYSLVLFLIFLSFFAQKKNNGFSFYENKGQIINQNGKPNPEVKYLLNSPGLNVQIRSNGFSYDVYEIETKDLKKKKSDNNPILDQQKNLPKKEFKYKYHRIDIDFVDSKSNPKILAEEKSEDYENYYNIPDKKEGVSFVHRYKKITYKNLYNNIDLVFFKPEDSTKPVEYNFLVHPGGKISDIKMRFKGAKTKLKDGKLSMNLRFGEMQENIPNSWIENDRKQNIAVNYKDLGNQTFGFESSVNTSDQTIVIDPVPTRIWGSYLGGEGNEWGMIKSDVKNNIYIYGYTTSTYNFSTSGAYQIVSAGRIDAYVNKVTKEGKKLWGTYYGNKYNDNAGGLDIDIDDNVYIGITTQIPNPSYPGNFYYYFPKIVLLKLKQDGTFIFHEIIGKDTPAFGGDLDQFAVYDLKLNNNEVFIIGQTRINGFSTPGAYQETVKGNQCGFISKLNKDGDLDWFTYIGGDNGSTLLSSIFNVEGDDIEIMGTTFAKDFPMVDPFQETYNGLNNGLYLKFSSSGSLIKSSYVGGDNYYRFTCARRIGNDIIFGAREIFRYKFSYFTVDMNSNSVKSTNEIDVHNTAGNTYIDTKGNIFLTGLGCPNDNGITNITTSDAYQPIIGKYCSIYLLKYNSSFQKEWGTFYSGNGGTQIGTVTKDDEDSIYLWGLSNNNTTGIATPGTFQQTGHSQDLFIAKFKDCSSFAQLTSNSPVCEGQEIQLGANGGASYDWTGPNGFTSKLQNPKIPNATLADAGTYTCAVTGTGGCDTSTSITIVVGDTIKPIPDNPTLTKITGDCKTVITIIPTATDNCKGQIFGTTTDPLSYQLPGNYTITWKYDDGNGNIAIQTQQVEIIQQPLPTWNSSQVFCKITKPKISDIAVTATNPKWYDANGNVISSLSQELVDNTKYYVTQTANGCESAKTEILIQLSDPNAPTGNPVQDFCSASNPTLKNIAVTGTAVKWFNNLGILLPETTALQNGETYFATQTVNSCESTQKLAVKVNVVTNYLSANDFTDAFCNDTTADFKTINIDNYKKELITNPQDYKFEIRKTNGELVSGNTNLNIGTNIFDVKIISSLGCFQFVKLSLTLNEKPKIDLPQEQEFCDNVGTPLKVDFVSGYSYLWNTGETSHSIIADKEQTYTLTVTTPAGCSNTGSTIVKKAKLAEIQNIIITNNSAIIVMSFAGDYLYSLDQINWKSENKFDNLDNGNYTVFVKTKLGCDLGSKSFTIFSLSNIFSPNGDGINDTWKISGIENYPNSEIKIFDRQGKMIIKQITKGEAFEWNGESNGRLLPTDSYWYQIKLSDGRILEGYVVIKNRN